MHSFSKLFQKRLRQSNSVLNPVIKNLIIPYSLQTVTRGELCE